MRDEDFQELLGAVQEAVEHYEGRGRGLRATLLPAPPAPIVSAEIRALRERTGLSQRVFALALNVSVKTVQAWEAGTRIPEGGNLKLLRLGEAHPEIVFAGLSGPSHRPARTRAPRKAKPRAA